MQFCQLQKNKNDHNRENLYMIIDGNEIEKAAMAEFHKGNRKEHVPNCMRTMLNKKIQLLSELTEHTIANEIEPPKEILRKQE